MKKRKRLASGAVGVLMLSALGTGAVAGAAPAPATPPGVPTTLRVTPITTAISISWKAPASTGDSPILGYLATASPGSATCSTTGATSCLIVGLADGLAYTVRVQALNKVGRSAAASVAGVKPTTAQNCVYRGPYANLKSCDLTGTNLSGIDLVDADLAHADIEGANLSDGDLAGANLNGAELTGATLAGTSSGYVTGIPAALPTGWEPSGGYLVGPDADLAGANLAGANLDAADLAGADLRGAELARADLNGADLAGADLSDTDLERANLDGALFDGADLEGGDLAGAELADANMTGADLSSADLDVVVSGGVVGTPGPLPSGWSVTDGYLVGPDADLAGANLSGVRLYAADLSGADLSDADLAAVDLSLAELAGADLAGADLAGADLFETDLTGADLSETDLTGADLWGATTTTTLWSETTCPDGTDSDSDGDTCVNNEGDAGAQAALNTALTDAKSYYEQNDQSYGDTDTLVAALVVQEPSLIWTTETSVTSHEISVTTSADGNAIILAAESTTGNCWYIVDNAVSEASATGPPWSEPGAVFDGQGTIYGEVKNVGTPPTCAASAAPAGPNSATQAFETTGGFPDL